MTVLQLLFAVLLLLGNAFFVGAEFALVSVRRSQIEPLAAHHRRARTVIHGIEHLSMMLAAAQFGITVCSLALGAVAEPTVERLLEGPFHTLGVPGHLSHLLSYLIALSAVVFLHLVVGEMVPKNIAMAKTEKAALWLGPALVGFTRALRPLIAFFNACANGMLRLLRVEPKDEVESAFTSEELTHLVEDSRQAGLLGPAEKERLEDALELGSRPVTDVLLKHEAVVTVDPSVTPREVEDLTVRTGYSRFPVTAPGGAFHGYLHVKDVLDLDEQDRPVPRRIWRPMAGLAADLPLDDALTTMRRAASHLAAVEDAEGRVLGVVALEDVLEMLVGEVRDPAHRRPAPRAPHAARAPYTVGRRGR
ncbi:hemolysin family protein [Streptomyces capparidis]